MAQQRSEETRARLLEAAVRQFAIAGYTATSVEEICTAAGVSKGAFYHHFPTKQSLFLALLEGWLKTVDMGLDALRGSTVPQTLTNMTSLLPGILASADERLPMFLEFWLQASRDETIWNATIAPYHHYQETFASLIEAGIAEGSIKPVDPQSTARVIVSMAVGLFLQGLLDPKGVDWDKVARESMQVLMHGLAK